MAPRRVGLLVVKLMGCTHAVQVGWFLHTPFPSSEIYRTLPVREEVLRAVLKADLIGFHTYDYARHFVSACTRILGLEVCNSIHLPLLPLVESLILACTLTSSGYRHLLWQS